MSDYFIHYASSNILGAVIFAIMLFHDVINIDKQEKQIKYDHALIAFMLYFISDALWAGVDSGVFPVNTFTVFITNFLNFILMTEITYRWLLYVLAVEQVPHRNNRRFRTILFLPFIISSIVFVIVFIAFPGFLVDDNMKTTGFFDAFLVVVPYIYVVAIIVYAIRKARREEDPKERKKHLYIGFFPLMTVAGGLTQMILMPSLPMFCYSCTVLMTIFYVQAMEGRISTDPLTNINNRGQLMRYISLKNNLSIEGRRTYIMMIDINDFKKINDTYGHAEGDRALVIVSEALKDTLKEQSIPIFLARYGGDEFIIVAHPQKAEELESMIISIRKRIEAECERNGAPYIVSISIGYEELSFSAGDTFQRCQQAADDKMYLDKKELKSSGRSTVLK